MTTQCIFPVELVCEILCYTTLMDVVRWRRVSKWFCAITHDPKIWQTFYVNAPFLRPPGPFPTLDFERAFVKSAKLARSWTTQGLRDVSRISVPFDGWIPRNLQLIDGRWLVVCQSCRRFVVYDTNVDAETREPRVIWEQAEDIVAWDMCLAMSEDGEWIVYVLLSTEDPIRWMLLEIRLNAETGVPCGAVAFDVPVSISAPKSDEDEDVRLELDGGQELLAPSSSRFLSIPGQSLVFDTRTRIFYGFPEFYVARDETLSRIGSAIKGIAAIIVPTNTHVIVLHQFLKSGQPYYVVQAFTVPDGPGPLESGEGVLRLSHEGVFTSQKMPFAIIRNSIINPSTGAISVKLLERDLQWNGFKSTCITLVLDKPSLDEVSSISVNRRRILIRGDVPSEDDLNFCNVYYDISDGYARGFFTRDGRCTGWNTQSGVIKFTIDATKHPCIAVLSGFSRAGEWLDNVSPADHFLHLSNEIVLWDGVRGRFSYVDKEAHCDTIENTSLIVVDVE